MADETSAGGAGPRGDGARDQPHLAHYSWADEPSLGLGSPGFSREEAERRTAATEAFGRFRRLRVVLALPFIVYSVIAGVITGFWVLPALLDALGLASDSYPLSTVIGAGVLFVAITCCIAWAGALLLNVAARRTAWTIELVVFTLLLVAGAVVLARGGAVGLSPATYAIAPYATLVSVAELVRAVRLSHIDVPV